MRPHINVDEDRTGQIREYTVKGFIALSQMPGLSVMSLHRDVLKFNSFSTWARVFDISTVHETVRLILARMFRSWPGCLNPDPNT